MRVGTDVLLVAIGVILRILLHLLVSRESLCSILLDSPLFSSLAVDESAALQRWETISLYSTDVVKMPPLVIYLLSCLPNSSLARMSFITGLQLATALLLSKVSGLAMRYIYVPEIVNRGQAVNKFDGEEEFSNSLNLETAAPSIVASSYILNPIIILTSTMQNFAALYHLTAILVLYFSLTRSPVSRIGLPACLAVMVYIHPGSSIGLPLAMAFVRYRIAQRNDWEWSWAAIPVLFKEIFLLYLTSALFFCGLLAGSYVVHGSWEFLDAAIVGVLGLRDLTPDVGLFWYIFTLCFDRYRALYLFVFHLHAVIPFLALSVWMDFAPLAYGTLCTAAVLITSPHPIAADFSFALTLLLVYWTPIRTNRAFPFFGTVAVLSVAIIPVMSMLWLTRDTGNANFLYALQLAQHIAFVHIITQWAEWFFDVPTEASRPRSNKSVSRNSFDQVQEVG